MITVIILLVILGGGGMWMYRQGKKNQEGDQAQADMDKLQEINENDKTFDEETDDIFRALRNPDDGDSSV